jgi:glycosyltransferase 2 family protein
MRVRILKWAGVLLSVALIAYIATRFDLAAALKAVALADPSWLAIATLAYLAQFPLRGLRWSILMRAVKPVSFATATEIFMIGFMANNVLPARLGDVARAFILAKRENVPASATFSNVLLERVFDGIVVVAFLSLVLLIDPPAASWVGAVAFAMAMVFASAVVACGLVAWNEGRVLRLVASFLSFMPKELTEKIVALLAKLAQGIRCLKSPKETALVILLSLVIWSGEVAVYFLAERALGISISYLGLMLVMAILTLGLTAPSAPGFVGVYEGLIIAGVGVYGVTEPLAPAFAITMHLIHYVPGTLLGLIASWRSGMRLKELRRVEKAIEEEHALTTP